jgi:hypothetical protein
MILFLILASLAAVYYMSPMAAAAGKPERLARTDAADPETAAILTPGLVALGRALDQYGRGRQPPPAGSVTGEEVRKTERDRL